MEPTFDSQIVRGCSSILSLLAAEFLTLVGGISFVQEFWQVSVQPQTSWNRQMSDSKWPKTNLRDSVGLRYGPDSSAVLAVVCRHARPNFRGGLESAICVRRVARLRPTTDSASRLATLAIAASAERMYQLQHTRLRTLAASIGRALVRRCDVLMQRSFP